MMTKEREPLFGEPDYEPHPMLAVAMQTAKSEGRDARDVGHELISAGLYHFAENLCDPHLSEELEFLHGWIGERLAELRKMN